MSQQQDNTPSPGAPAPQSPDVEASPSEAEAVATEAVVTEAVAAPAEPEAAEAKAPAAAKSKAPAKAPKAVVAPVAESAPVAALRAAMEAHTPVKGKVIGWNNGGFHVVAHELTGFCPRSEMEVAQPKAPASYLDQEYDFVVLEIQKAGRRVVLSRAAILKGERTRRKEVARQKLTAGEVVKGRVASLTDFGAFVDLGGVQGLVHVSEISRTRVNNPSDVLEAGQEVSVKILKIEQDGKRVSLSMKALEPDPWDGVAQRFEEGAVVKGTIEKTAAFGAFVALEPGLTGLLPTAGLSLPRGASLARLFPAGKQISVQIMRLDPKKRRISLALEGSKTEGSRSDFEKYKKGQKVAESAEGFNAMAAAFEKLGRSSD